MEVTLYNAKARLMAGGLIAVDPIYTGGKRKSWREFFHQRRLKFRVLKDIPVQLSNGDHIVIETGYETDLCSVPRVFWGLLAPYGDFLLAYLIHDKLYTSNYGDRYFADKEMFRWACAIWDNNIDNWIRYQIVRWRGESWWQSSARKLAAKKNKLE